MGTEVEREIRQQFEIAESVMRQMKEDPGIVAVVNQVANVVYSAMSNGNKLLLAGNGGSAADAQHIAAEFVNYFGYERPALPAIALTTDSSVMTSISNDSEYKNVFARQLRALGKPGDVFFGYSTSGSSSNIIEAFKVAQDIGLVTVALTGARSPDIDPLCDIVINIPSTSTPKIQEGHLVVGHIISGIVEDMFFGDTPKSAS